MRKLVLACVTTALVFLTGCMTSEDRPVRVTVQGNFGEFDHYIYSEASGLHHRRNRHRIHRNGDDAEANKLGGIPALSGCSAVGSAHALGAWGRGFESHHSGQHQ